jgi:WD40 repeat protein
MRISRWGDYYGVTLLATIVVIFAASCHLAFSQEPRPTVKNEPVQLTVNTGVGGPMSIAVTPDGRFFATPAGSAIELWDIQKARRIRSFSGLKNSAFTVAMSRDGTQIAAATSAAGEGELSVWDVATGHVIVELRVSAAYHNYGSGRPWSMSSALAFTADGRRIIDVGSFDTRTAGYLKYATEFGRIIDIATGNIVKSLEATSNYNGRSLDLSPDGGLFAVGCYGGLVRVYDIDGRSIRSLASHNTEGSVNAVLFSPDGRLLALANSTLPPPSQSMFLWPSKFMVAAK